MSNIVNMNEFREQRDREPEEDDFARGVIIAVPIALAMWGMIIIGAVWTYHVFWGAR